MNLHGMRGWRAVVVLGLVSGVLFGGLMSFFIVLVSNERNVGLVVLLGTVGGVVFGVAFAFIVARQSRGLVNAITAKAVQSAIRNRRLPETTDDAWWSALRYRKQLTSSSRWLNPLVFSVLAGLGVINFALVPAWLGWVEVIGFPLVGLLTFVQANRELSAIGELERQAVALA